MKILITWVGPWLDKGEAAMIISMVKALRERIPNVSITVSPSSFQPQEIDIIKYSEYDLKVLPGIFSSIFSVVPKLKFLKFTALKAMIALPVFPALMVKNILWLISYKSLRFDAGFLIRDNRDTVKEYRDADWVVFCGGEYILGVSLGLLIALYEIMFSKLLGKPVMLYAQSFGPFKQKYARPLIKRILNKVDVITTREGNSKKYLEDIGVTAPVFETADAAFTLPVISQEEALSLIERETEIPKNELMVGITAIYRDFPSQKGQIEETVENYLKAMAEAIDYIITKLNAYAIFFPHNKTIYTNRNDELASMKIFEKIKNKSKMTILTDDYSPEQLKGMYGCMSLFIGTRYHSCIFALSMNVPTIPIGYTHKAPGITKMLGLEAYLVDINTITTHELTSKIDKIWAERDEVKKNLEKNIKVMQAKSMENVRLAVEYLGLREANMVND
jgi:colanic acid/amylovoran biosynthesis protein